MNTSAKLAMVSNEADSSSCEVTHELEMHFDADECEKRFLQSGDRNHDIHSVKGLGIVQGMLVLEYIGAAVSRVVPGYVFCGYLQPVMQKSSIFAGETANVTLICPESKKKLVRVHIRVCVGEVLVLENEAFLMEKGTFLKKMRRR